MPKKWSEVESSAGYTSLSDADKEIARNQYFDEVVKPQLSAEDVAAAKSQFDSSTRKTKPVEDTSYDASEYQPPKEEGRLGRISRLMNETKAEMGGDPTKPQGFLKSVTALPRGVADAAATMISGIPATAAAGLYALSQGDDSKDRENVEEVQKKLTWKPRTSAGELISELASTPMSLLNEGLGYVGGKIGSLVGPKTEAALETAGENVVPLVTAAKGARKVVENFGKPTSEMVPKTPTNIKDENIQKAREAGYVIPEDNLMTGYGGKIKTEQAASAKNQTITNKKAAREIGLPEAAELTDDAFGALKKEYGKPYAEVSKLGELDITGVKGLPKDLKVSKTRDNMAMGKEIVTVDAGELVKQWKQANFESRGYQKAFQRDANPETLVKAQAAQADAMQMERMIRKVAQEKGTPELVDALKEARVKLAKVHNVESATNTATGNVNAAKLAKSKHLTGELQDIKDFQRIAPKSAKTPESIGAVSEISPLDTAVGGMEAATAISSGHYGAIPAIAGQIVGRGLARKYSLSDAYQKRLTKDKVKVRDSQLENVAPASVVGAQEAEEEQRRIPRIELKGMAE